tara:strand:+ start:863 stop:1396 length:534 start_codon:yes stop_codon:yes gene_type:complete
LAPAHDQHSSILGLQNPFTLVTFHSITNYTKMAALMQSEEFQHILRVLNTNIDGNTKILFAITKIPGVGRRFAHVILKKAEIDSCKRAGELTKDEVETMVAVISNPAAFKVPSWMLNNQKDFATGKHEHLVSTSLHTKLRNNIERLKKARVHRGLRHYWGIRVRGQHTKTTGRRKGH